MPETSAMAKHSRFSPRRAFPWLYATVAVQATASLGVGVALLLIPPSALGPYATMTGLAPIQVWAATLMVGALVGLGLVAVDLTPRVVTAVVLPASLVWLFIGVSLTMYATAHRFVGLVSGIVWLSMAAEMVLTSLFAARMLGESERRTGPTP